MLFSALFAEDIIALHTHPGSFADSVGNVIMTWKRKVEQMKNFIVLEDSYVPNFEITKSVTCIHIKSQ